MVSPQKRVAKVPFDKLKARPILLAEPVEARYHSNIERILKKCLTTVHFVIDIKYR